MPRAYLLRTIPPPPVLLRGQPLTALFYLSVSKVPVVTTDNWVASENSIVIDDFLRFTATFFFPFVLVADVRDVDTAYCDLGLSKNTFKAQR